MTTEQGGRSSPVAAGHVEVYNVCDKGDTDQGSINKILESIFGIETGFQGTMISTFAKVPARRIQADSKQIAQHGLCD